LTDKKNILQKVLWYHGTELDII